ncbi:MAG: glycosyltransferase family 2 protein [Verrucomicrobia bacterium]|nr:MAG: glycosyltransferase family 2 protein [Verrucomicrobiota bacterium]
MPSTPALTIVIPCYNEEKYITKAIESLLHQSFTDFRAVISDNASTDETVKLAKSAINGDSRFEVICQQKNIGSAGNLKFLLTCAQTEFFMFLGAHDFLSKGYLDICVSSIRSRPDVSIATTRAIGVDESDALNYHRFLEMYDFSQESPVVRYIESVAKLEHCTCLQGVVRTHQIRLANIKPIASNDHIIISRLLWYGKLKYTEGEAYYRRYFTNREQSYMERITGSSNSEIDRGPFIDEYVKDFNRLFAGEDHIRVFLNHIILEILHARFGKPMVPLGHKIEIR